MSDCPTTKVNISLFSPNRFVNLSQPQVCKEYSFSNFLSSGKELLYVTLWSDGQNKILKGSNPYFESTYAADFLLPLRLMCKPNFLRLGGFGQAIRWLGLPAIPVCPLTQVQTKFDHV